MADDAQPTPSFDPNCERCKGNGTYLEGVMYMPCYCALPPVTPDAVERALDADVLRGAIEEPDSATADELAVETEALTAFEQMGRDIIAHGARVGDAFCRELAGRLGKAMTANARVAVRDPRVVYANAGPQFVVDFRRLLPGQRPPSGDWTIYEANRLPANDERGDDTLEPANS